MAWSMNSWTMDDWVNEYCRELRLTGAESVSLGHAGTA